ncbi:MAG: beta-galactosidase [Lachnospiraceae bacterium]|nr:beta-galactosidase [Lachnospiraceae bacterium]
MREQSEAKRKAGSKITMGVCYYPEHWDESMWEDDLRRMKEYGISVIRIAEFAWNKFESEEGSYTFDFFDRFLAVAAKWNMNVIMCTPTATPPAWMTTKYPEVLNADKEGHLYRHGMRRHANMNSKMYQHFTKIIVEKLAEHYADNPSIIGWQLDNEINCEMEVYYSESDHLAFRAYLKEKYQTLDKLNQAMGTVFWNQTYTDWDQVALAQKTNTGGTNPHMALEEKRFISETVISYFRLQADILRTYIKDSVFLTTNGLFNNIDYHRLIQEGILDFITYDNYPDFAYEVENPYRDKVLKDRNMTFNITRARSISSYFGIMEQQSGAGGWNFRMQQPMPKPGQMRLWALGAIALGADFVSFFRWRTCTFGTEIYWHGLNDYSNTPNRRLEELATIHEDIKMLQLTAGTKYIAQVGIITDYDNSWDGDIDLWHGPLRRNSVEGIVRALELGHITYDFINLTDETLHSELKKYPILFYPHATILTEARVKILEEYTADGGIIVFGSRSGYKLTNGQCTTLQMPGLLRNLCGVVVSDYTFASPDREMMQIDVNGRKLPALCFHDILRPETAAVLGTFDSDYYKGLPGFTVNYFGKGCAYYYGAGFAEETVAGILEELSIRPWAESYLVAGNDIQITMRKGDKERYLFVLNYGDKEQTIEVKGNYLEIISQKREAGEQKMEAYGVKCYQIME